MDETGTLSTPADGPVAWTAQADLAEAAAVILSGEHQFDGPTPPLTGSQALDFDAIMTIVSELKGTPASHRVIDEAEMIATMVANGVPEFTARFSLTMFAAAHDGDFATVDPTLTQLLGREPTPLREILAKAIETTPSIPARP